MCLKTYLCPPHVNICALSTPSYFCTSDVAHYVCSCFLGSLGLGWVFSFFLSFFREAPKTEYSSSKVLNNCIPHNHVDFFLQEHNLPFNFQSYSICNLLSAPDPLFQFCSISSLPTSHICSHNYSYVCAKLHIRLYGPLNSLFSKQFIQLASTIWNTKFDFHCLVDSVIPATVNHVVEVKS